MTSRRDFLRLTAAGTAAAILGRPTRADDAREQPFELKYILSSCMYGYTKLESILPEVARTGSAAIDIWPKVHGDQREQLDELGEERFAAMLEKHGTRLGCLTQYKLGPFGLKDEMKLAKRFGCETIVTGGKGPKGLKGAELKAGVATFVEQLKPHLAGAAENGVTIAIENHGNNLIDSPDSVRHLVDLAPEQVGIALAPYHLPQDTELLAKLIRDLGNRIRVFYAWQHGMGCMTKLPKDQELLQMPGRGDLDFGPLLEALADVKFDGWTSIFMHPVPRGIPILETTAEVTMEINRARKYLDGKLPHGRG